MLIALVPSRYSVINRGGLGYSQNPSSEGPPTGLQLTIRPPRATQYHELPGLCQNFRFMDSVSNVPLAVRVSHRSGVCHAEPRKPAKESFHSATSALNLTPLE